MNQRLRQLMLLIIVCCVLGLGVLALLRYQETRRLHHSNGLADGASSQTPTADLWARAVEKVKEDRGESGAAALEIPTQLRHYEDRHWFLATQVAAVEKFNVQSSQDFVDLGAMLARGELIQLPAVTENYILFGVGARADDEPFNRYIDDHNIPVYNEAELGNAYARLDSERTKLQTEISDLQKQSTTLKKAARAKRSELQKEITTRQQELQAKTDEKALLDRAYGEPGTRQRLTQDYESLQTLARNFAGRSYNLGDPADRLALKVSMLSSLRPQALKVLEELAKAYHDQFARPLPVSSLVRPEQYQHALRKVNRNAVLIDTPPHSTGLAFDIDYRYMSAGEQNFLMKELARLKDEGRIEVLRERSANYHVFAFVDGRRPSDELITASLEDAGAPPVEEAHHATTPTAAKTAKSAKTSITPGTRSSGLRVSKGSKGKKTNTNSKAKKARRR